jgi:DNA ligase D-like protein (predicted ligase)
MTAARPGRPGASASGRGGRGPHRPQDHQQDDRAHDGGEQRAERAVGLQSDYNRFEGVIPKGEYGGGPVLIWDRGVWIPEGDPDTAYRKGALKFRLEGEKLHGSWVLVRTRQAQGSKEQWLLIKHEDDAARPGAKQDIVAQEPRSVVSGRTIEEIGPSFHRHNGRPVTGRLRSTERVKRAGELPGARRASLPAKIKPELATLVDEAPGGNGWLHEIKYDGYRALCRIAHGKARRYTRRGNDWTDKFEPIARAVLELPIREAWLDGEIVVLTAKGVTSFPALVDALGEETGRQRLLYYVFDLLHLDGFDLRQAPLEARKQALRRLVRDGTIRYSDHIVGRGPRFFEEACRAGLEGTIAKRAGSRYVEGRGRDWLKVKCVQKRELAIVGYTDPRGGRKGFGALVLGEASDGHMIHVGRVGTGFSDRMLRDLLPRLQALEVGHADGRLAEGPLALCDVQAYSYAARLGMAQVARALGKNDVAEREDRRAEALRRAFEEAYWIEHLGTYALALDGRKERCEVRSSCAGHALSTGIASAEHARVLAQTLLSGDHFSGWGIGTLARSAVRFNPMSYHNGSVWPHDNALIGLGLARHGHTASVERILTALFEASRALEAARLPELMCGFQRQQGKAPTLYPVACSPQAWAAGSVFLLVQALLGLTIHAESRQVRLNRPRLPPFLNALTVRHLRVGEGEIDLLFERAEGEVVVRVLRRTAALDLVVTS